MTRYKLNPAVFDLDEEYEATPTFDNHGRYTVAIPGYEPILVPASMLVEVEPPLPPEPPNMSTVQAGARAYLRDCLPGDADIHWYGPGGRRTWAEVCQLAFGKTGLPPVLLVPAPEPVELPWEQERGDLSLDPIRVYRVYCDGGPLVVMRTGGVTRDLDPTTAREMARALWTAADQAEAAS